jgi:transcriptional regulator with XRE-family HTH domain
VVRRPRHRLAKRLAAQLQVQRGVRGWTQEIAAERCGLITRHYQKLESGKINATLATLERLSEAFEIDVVDLLKPTG